MEIKKKKAIMEILITLKIHQKKRKRQIKIYNDIIKIILTLKILLTNF